MPGLGELVHGLGAFDLIAPFLKAHKVPDLGFGIAGNSVIEADPISGSKIKIRFFLYCMRKKIAPPTFPEFSKLVQDG